MSVTGFRYLFAILSVCLLWYIVVQCLGGRLDSWGLFLAGARHFSLSCHIQSGSGANPASCPMGTRGSAPKGKARRSVKLTTYFHLVPKSRKNEVVLPLLSTSSLLVLS